MDPRIVISAVYMSVALVVMTLNGLELSYTRFDAIDGIERMITIMANYEDLRIVPDCKDNNDIFGAMRAQASRANLP